MVTACGWGRRVYEHKTALSWMTVSVQARALQRTGSFVAEDYDTIAAALVLRGTGLQMEPKL